MTVHDRREDTFEARTLPAGTILHLNGLPVRLTEPVAALSSAANWLLILKQGQTLPMN